MAGLSERLRGWVWLAEHWVTGAGFMAAALLALTPALATVMPLPLLLIFLHSPGYMVHQVEEHTGDRFRSFANGRVFGGRDALSVAAVLVINVPVVWGLNLAALYAALAFGPGWGLVAPYAMLVNGITHIGARARLGVYNPGLVTAVALFLPLSLATIFVVGALPEVGFAQHAFGLAVALVLHLLIIVYVLTRLRSR
ncbi:HXXEE domain-containing protein [Bosea sp. 117]|uniref:HXXEE domain-containing protein n=1 Tax=Bosea sp. 117 TaxID=1125973 RepID=UPI0004942646|nr:HXXEE domain-containing protein [Bosea sp. 117]